MPPDDDPPTPGHAPPDGPPPPPGRGSAPARPPTGRDLLQALFAEVVSRPESATDTAPPEIDATLAALHAELTGLYAGMLAATARLDRDGRIDPPSRAAAHAALHDLRAALREIERHGRPPPPER